MNRPPLPPLPALHLLLQKPQAAGAWKTEEAGAVGSPPWNAMEKAPVPNGEFCEESETAAHPTLPGRRLITAPAWFVCAYCNTLKAVPRGKEVTKLGNIESAPAASPEHALNPLTYFSSSVEDPLSHWRPVEVGRQKTIVWAVAFWVMLQPAYASSGVEALIKTATPLKTGSNAT